MLWFHYTLQHDGRNYNMQGKAGGLYWCRRVECGSAPTALLSRATHSYWMSVYPGSLLIAGKSLFRKLELCKVIPKNGGFFFLAFLSFPF